MVSSFSHLSLTNPLGVYFLKVGRTEHGVVPKFKKLFGVQKLSIGHNRIDLFDKRLTFNLKEINPLNNRLIKSIFNFFIGLKVLLIHRWYSDPDCTVGI